MLIKTNSQHDFVFFGLQSWDIDIGSNCKNLAIEVSKTNRVLYINRALDRKSQYFSTEDKTLQQRVKVFNSRAILIEQINKNLWVCTPSVRLESINWIKVNFMFDWFNKFNNKKLSRNIKEAIHTLGFNDIYFFNDNDFFRGQFLNKLLNPKIYIYYIRDYLNFQSYFSRHGKRLEPKIMKSSDLVVANSGYLAQYAKTYNPKSFYIGQGCDLSQFQAEKKYQKPSDLEKISIPIIGYVGALHSERLDIELLIDVAKGLPQYSFVFVGPEDNFFKNSELHFIDNVYFLGSKDQNSLSSYIAHFDVCMNPQKQNELTMGNYPRKIDEYLAMGKPVVATNTETMKMFDQFVHLCNDATSYIKAIKQADAEKEQYKSERIDFAKSHSWENNVNELYLAIETLEQ